MRWCRILVAVSVPLLGSEAWAGRECIYEGIPAPQCQVVTMECDTGPNGEPDCYTRERCDDVYRFCWDVPDDEEPLPIDEPPDDPINPPGGGGIGDPGSGGGTGGGGTDPCPGGGCDEDPCGDGQCSYCYNGACEQIGSDDVPDPLGIF